MFYIHHSAAISPQQTFGDIDLTRLHEYSENKMRAIEPAYEGIPASLLRRMGKAVKIGVGTSISLLKKNPSVHGIVLGTAHGGLEDCIKFLNQIVEYQEGILAPGNFVQSTANAVASQIGLLTANKSYNITHVHRGHAFENAMLDAEMLVKEIQSQQFLLAGVDEISSYNFNIDRLDGWHKKEALTNKTLYEVQSSGSMAGEGAAAFLVSAQSADAIARVEGLKMMHGKNSEQLKLKAETFLKEYGFGDSDSDLLLSGENGDARLLEYYLTLESLISAKPGIYRFKHLCGEYPTATAYALWLACQILNGLKVPPHMVKRKGNPHPIRRILIYNNFKIVQHSLILVSTPLS
jgi:hypothetical protein